MLQIKNKITKVKRQRIVKNNKQLHQSRSVNKFFVSWSSKHLSIIFSRFQLFAFFKNMATTICFFKYTIELHCDEREIFHGGNFANKLF